MEELSDVQVLEVVSQVQTGSRVQLPWYAVQIGRLDVLPVLLAHVLDVVGCFDLFVSQLGNVRHAFLFERQSHLVFVQPDLGQNFTVRPLVVRSELRDEKGTVEGESVIVLIKQRERLWFSIDVSGLNFLQLEYSSGAIALLEVGLLLVAIPHKRLRRLYPGHSGGDLLVGQYGRGIDKRPNQVALLILSLGFVQFFKDTFLVAGGQLGDADPALDGGVLSQPVHLVVIGPAIRTHATCASSHYIAKIINETQDNCSMEGEEKSQMVVGHQL